MNWLDVIMVLILVGGIVSGYKNGFVGEMASLAGLILGIWGAIKFSGWTTQLLEGFGLSFSLMPIISFVITFLVITIIMQIVAGLINNLLEVLTLNLLNKLAGIVAGVFKSALFCSVILLVYGAVDEKHRFLPESAVEKSLLWEPVSELVPSLLPFLNIDELRTAGSDEDPEPVKSL